MTDPRVASIDAMLAAALPMGSLHAVGGRVRDEVRTELDGVARPAKDLDYVVLGLGLEDLIGRLAGVGPADVVGASFAVVKLLVGGEQVDIALPRRECSTGLGHRDFIIEAGPEVRLEDDLSRRDFRMNMMARRLPDGVLIDPYAGAADVRAGRIDILRPTAFEEDPLRILRAVQFAARFEYAVTPGTIAAMAAAAPLLSSVSAERVRDELLKLLIGARRPSLGFELLRVTGALPVVLPELAEGIGVEQNEYHAFDVYRHGLATLDAVPAGDATLRLAALFHDVGKPRTKDGPHFYRHELVGAEMARRICERLRFPADTATRIERLVRHHMYAADPHQEARTIRRFIRRIGPDLLEEQFSLRAADVAGSGLPARGRDNERFEARVREVLAERPPLSVRDLAVDGRDVISALARGGRVAIGSRGGPEVGRLLQALLEEVTDDPARNERDELLRALDALVHGGPAHTSPSLEGLEGSEGSEGLEEASSREP